MAETTGIIEAGKALGYEGESLRAYVKGEQDRLRDERARERETKEREREAREFELREEREREAREFELRKMELGGVALGSPRPRGPKIPPFDEAHDEMDNYLKSFEVYATAQGIRKEEWAIHLSALLKGKCLDVYALLMNEKALDYDFLKTALLQRYELTKETFKRKFRPSKPEAGESFVQFVTRLRSYFRRWIDMFGIDKTYDRLFDFMVCDQFLFMCNVDLKTFLLEKRCESVEALASMADMYREARMVSAVSLSRQNKKQTQNKTDNKSVANGSSSGQQSGQSRQGDNRTCFNCNKAGHIATKCPNNENTGINCYICNKTTHIARDCPHRNRVAGIIEQDTQEDDEELHGGMSTCGACTIIPETLTDARASMPTCVKEPIMAHLASGVQSLMPVLQGKMAGKVVDVLRDTGSSGVVVKKGLVPEECFSGQMQMIRLADGSVMRVPLAEVEIDTPYYTGKVQAWCFDCPLYDVMVGNIPGALDPDKPNLEQTQVEPWKHDGRLR